jgi:hypothetical protein
MREAAAQTDEVRTRAVRALEGSALVREALGWPLQCLPVSQSSSTEVVDGRRRSVAAVALEVVGPRGRAAAAARSAPGEGAEDFALRVTLPGGRVVDLGEGGGPGKKRKEEGTTIDVAFRTISDSERK